MSYTALPVCMQDLTALHTTCVGRTKASTAPSVLIDACDIHVCAGMHACIRGGHRSVLDNLPQALAPWFIFESLGLSLTA